MEREAVRVDTTDFMQKLSQHAQQTGELMEEAIRQMEMLQAETFKAQQKERTPMERITSEENFCYLSMCEELEQGGCPEGAHCTERKVWERLKAYEDTGLSPEEVEHLKLASMGKAIAEITEFEGIPIDRMRELAQAEKEGRCVVLPCKVRDKAWYLTGKPSAARQPHFDRIDSEIVGGFYYDERGLQVRLNYFHGNHGTYGFFGKTVFLTREEAQEALKEREGRP